MKKYLLCGLLCVSFKVWCRGESFSDMVITAPDITEDSSPQVTDRIAVDNHDDSLNQVLERSSGVRLQGGPRSIAQQPSIRGLSDERVQIRVDGARQGFQNGHRGQLFVDPDTLGTVDVYKGGHSSLFGSGAVGGVLSFKTKTAADMLTDDKNYGGKVGFGYGQNDVHTKASGLLYGRCKTDHGATMSALAGVTWRRRRDFTDAKGVIYKPTGDRIMSAIANGQYVQESHSMGVNYSYFNNDHPTLKKPDGASGTITKRLTTQQTLSGSYGYNPNNPLIDLKTQVYYTQTRVRENDQIEYQRQGLYKDETRFQTVGGYAENAADFIYSDGVDGSLKTGAELYREDLRGKRDGEEWDGFPKAHGLGGGVFLSHDLFWQRWVVTVGGRYDSLRQRFNKTARSASHLSPKARLAYELTDHLTVYGSYTESFRAPSLTDLFGGGRHFARPVFTNGRMVGVAENLFEPNATLKAERAKTKEVGFVYNRPGVFMVKDRLQFKAAAFYTHMKDFMDIAVSSVPTSADRSTWTDYKTQRVNVPQSYIYGAEGGVHYASPAWFGFVTASIAQGRQKRGDKVYLNRMPAARLVAELGHKWHRADLQLAWRAVVAARVSRLGFKERATPAYHVHNARLVYTPKALKGAYFMVGVDNVLNAQYRDHLSGLPQMGRCFKIGISYTF
jgi:hemoglobin/transferrin/lactoferrin receptor protein